MKKIVFLTMLLGVFNVNAKEIKVTINGMVCSMCAQGIQKKFSGQESIKELNVDMDQKLVNIETHEGKDISDSTITDLVKEAGYNVAKIERK